MIKNTETKVKMAQISAGTFAGLALLTMGTSVTGMICGDEIMNNFLENKEKIVTSNTYKNHISDQKQALYDLYRDGAIDANEYSSRLKYLNSDRYISEQGHKFLKDDDCMEYIKAQHNVENNQILSSLSMLSSFLCMSGSGLAVQTFLEQKKKLEQAADEQTIV